MSTSILATERSIYPSKMNFMINQIAFPLKMIIPQPIIRRIPWLLTNEATRTAIVKKNVHGKLLDIGCGTNCLAREYRAEGGDGVGVDVYDWGAVDLVVKDAAKLPYPDQSFNTISFVACLHHIPNREQVLKEAVRLLASQGRVIVTSTHPLLSRIWHAYAFWDADQHERGMKEGEVYGFTMSQLTDLLVRNGFKVDRTFHYAWGTKRVTICSRAS